MDAAELLPCPCCTSTAIFMPKPAKAGHDWQTGYVQCVFCGLRTEGGEARHVAEAAWNRRAEARQAPLQWTREDLAEALALIDGVTLQDIKSTVGPAEDTNNWRKYLGNADDVLSHLSFIASMRTENAPATLAPLPAGMVTEAVDNLRHNQRQLDMDGCEVGVSRQALEEVLDAFAARHAEIRYVAVDHTGCIYTCEDEEQAIKIAKDIRDDTLAARHAEPVVVKGLIEAPTHRHKKRGTEYVLIGIGKMQSKDWFVCRDGVDIEEPANLHEVAIYRSVDDGSLWVRPREEFEDGRFEALSSITETGGAKE